MKNLFKSLLIFAAAAMSFSACVKPEAENLPNEEDFYYTFVLGSPETRSILDSDENGKFGKWENGDRLGTAVNEVKPGFSSVTTSNSPVTFSIYYKGGFEGGETVYAYYPYSSSTSSISEAAMTIPISQSQNGTVFDFDAMPMAAEGFVVPTKYAGETDKTEMGEISLLNLGSVIDFQVFSSNSTYAGETIVSVKFAANSAIAGNFTKNITAVKANDANTLTISGYTEKAVTTTVSNAPTIGATRDAAAHIYMVVAPTTGITGSVIVTTDKAVYTFNMTTAQTFKRAGLKSFGLNLGTCQNREADETNTATFVFNTTDGLEALGLELPAASAGTNVERVVSDFIVLTGDKGGNANTSPRVWNSSGKYNFRVNKNNTITFSILEGTIKKISFDAGSNFNLTVGEGTLSEKKWEGDASSVTFTNTDVERTDINTITVSYIGGKTPVNPTTLVMSDISCTNPEENENSLTFSWTAVDNAEGYQISTDGGNSFGETQSELSYTWIGLAAGRQYTIYVKAVGDGINYYTSEAKSQTGKTKASEGGDTPTDYSEGFDNVTIGGVSSYGSKTWSHSASSTSWSATYSSTQIATLATNGLNVAIGKSGDISFSGDNGITRLSFTYKSQGNPTTLKITVKSGSVTVYEKSTSLDKNSTGSISITSNDFSSACEGAFSVTIANTSNSNSLQVSTINWTSAK